MKQSVSTFGLLVFSQIRALVFDLDGLLIDSESGYRQAWLQALQTMGFDIQSTELLPLAGISADRLMAALNEVVQQSIDPVIFAQRSSEFWQANVELHGIPLMPGVDEVLAEASRLNWPFAVATNSHSYQAEKLLRLAGLENRFPVLVTREQVELPKPAPDLYRLAAARLDIPVNQCLVLEDSATGVQSALAAGMPVGWIPSFPDAIQSTDLTPVTVLKSLSEVADGMRRLSV